MIDSWITLGEQWGVKAHKQSIDRERTAHKQTYRSPHVQANEDEGTKLRTYTQPLSKHNVLHCTTRTQTNTGTHQGENGTVVPCDQLLHRLPLEVDNGKNKDDTHCTREHEHVVRRPDHLELQEPETKGEENESDRGWKQHWALCKPIILLSKYH